MSVQLPKDSFTVLVNTQYSEKALLLLTPSVCSVRLLPRGVPLPPRRVPLHAPRHPLHVRAGGQAAQVRARLHRPLRVKGNVMLFWRLQFTAMLGIKNYSESLLLFCPLPGAL